MSSRSLVVADAVTTKKVLRFTYSDKERVFAPFLLGLTNAGQLVTHGLVNIDSEAPQWRFFYLEKFQTEPAPVAHFAAAPGLLKKSEAAFKPPAFIVKVLAIHTKEQ